MRERQKGRSQEQAAARANLRSRQTAAKYEQLGQLPSERQAGRTYRTRPDPFADDWAAVVVPKLQAAPELEGKALFEWLCDQRPGRYRAGQLRTFQRHVADWRARHQAQVAVIEQVHRPGEVLQVDGTGLTDLGVTIAGVPFRHLLIHYVLPYSNWEWGRVAQSESLAALRLGLQSTLFKLGAVPLYHQTDNSSAATLQLTAPPDRTADTAGERGYTEGYRQLLAHFGLQPRCTHIRAPNENGDTESSHGHLKRALAQHLLLRGSQDFATLIDYEAFLSAILDKRNQGRQARLAEELAVMAPLRATPLTEWAELRVRVNQASLIRVQRNSYSVPTSLIGCPVTVRVYEWRLEVYYGSQLVDTLPRLVGADKHQVNYRHVIDSLLRKPGGFRDYRYRDDLFPSQVFRQAWEQLQQFYSPRKADLTYLRVLHLAARRLESEVACALELLLADSQSWDETDVEQLLGHATVVVPQVSRGDVTLAWYDQLLLTEGEYEPA